MPPPIEPTPKRQKLSPTQPAATTSQPDTTSQDTVPIQDNSTKHPSDPKSAWFGTWPRKAVPSTQVARESIASSNSNSNSYSKNVKASESASISSDGPSRSEVHARNASLALTLGRRVSNKALPADVAMTKDHAISSKGGKEAREKNGSLDHARRNRVDGVGKEERKRTEDGQNAGVAQTNTPAESIVPPTVIESTPEQPIKEQEVQQAAFPQSWIGWLAGSRSDMIPSKIELYKDIPDDTVKSTMVAAAPVAPVATVPPTTDTTQHTEETEIPDSQTTAETTQRRSWLPYWGSSTTPQSAPAVTTTENATKQADSSPTQSEAVTTSSISRPSNTKKNVELSTDPVDESKTSTAKDTSQTTQKSTGWIFWSRDVPAESKAPKSEDREGEMAVAGTPSQDKPRRASIKVDMPVQSETAKIQQQPSSMKQSENTKDTASIKSVAEEMKKKTQSERPKSEDLTSTASAVTLQSNKASATAIDTDRRLASSSPARPKKNYDHQLLPAFSETLHLPEQSSLLKRLGGLLSARKQSERRHVDLLERVPKVKNALAIGVHGYFPAPLLRSVLGQPTGTSIKFAEMAAQGVKRWSKSQGYDCRVKTAALEGEGKISERLDLLWKLLLNWIEEIRRADFVLVACHSQGVPVAIMLVAKLIHFGCLSSARVGICAMAGVNMGPFPEYKSRWIGGSAAELFDFSEPDSKVSKDYLAALEEALSFGVKITYVGSIDDQLVSLESALYTPLSHPHIYRAVSIDSKVHAPSFLSHLVGFALKLRNLGVHDHGLIRELSSPLAGSLYSSEGHSRIYEDPAIYDLAIAFALQTTSLTGQSIIQAKVKTADSSTSTSTSTATPTSNPYILPFAMRGVIEEDYVKTHLQDEVDELLQEFDRWQPTTKQLKDVKFRLEGIRSRL